MSEQTITVIMPTYNRPAELARALISVASQTRLPDEVFVVGDRCLKIEWQRSVAVARKTLGPVGIRLHPRNLQSPGRDWGATPRNYALLHAATDLIAYLDDDNTWHSQHLEILEKALVESGADLSWCGSIVHRPDGKAETRIPPDVPKWSGIDTSEILHTRKALDLIGCARGVWWPNYRYDCDWAFVERLMAGGAKTVSVKVPLCDYFMRAAEGGKSPVRIANVHQGR